MKVGVGSVVSREASSRDCEMVPFTSSATMRDGVESARASSGLAPGSFGIPLTSVLKVSIVFNEKRCRALCDHGPRLDHGQTKAHAIGSQT